MTSQKRQLGRINPFYFILILILSLLAGGFYWLAGAVNQQQDNIADWVSDKLDHQVEIELAQLSWINLSPKLELATVKVFAEDGSTQLLALDKLYLDLDLYDSIRYREVRLNDITIKGLKIGVERDSQGQIALQGLNQQGDSTPLFAQLLVGSNALNSIHLDSITVDFTDRQQAFLTGRYRIESAVIEHALNKWQTSGLLALPAALGDTVSFSADALLNEQKPELTTWQWHADLKGIHLSPMEHYLTFQNVSLHQGRFNAIVEGKGTHNRLRKAKVTLDLMNCQLINVATENTFSPVIIEQLSGQFDWQQTAQNWILSANDLHVGIGKKSWPLSSFELVGQGQTVTAKGTFVRIEDLLDIIALSGQLPEQARAQKPQGELQNYHFVYAPDVGLTVAQFQLQGGTLLAWRDYPGIDNVQATVKLQDDRAQIELASKRVTIAPATWLKDPVFLDEISGKITMAFDSKQQRWSIDNERVAIHNSDLRLQLDGSIAQIKPGEIVNDIILTIDELAIARWQSYFPEKILKPRFKKWANKAFLAGKINQGEIHLKGDLAAFPYESKQDRARGEFKMALAVEDVQLHYAENWPDLFDVKGQVTGRGNSLMIQSQQGSIAGFTFKNVDVDIEKLIEREPILTVKGQLRGSTQKALNFLQNSPLDKRFGSISRAVSAKGQSLINLGLSVPLADTLNTEVVGNISFLKSHLYKKGRPELGIEQIQGRLGFDNSGVRSDNLTGQLLNQAINVIVYPKDDGTVIAAKGAMSSYQLSTVWPKTVKGLLEGNANYQLDVFVSERGIGHFYTDITLASDLKGMAVTLPAPFGKAANARQKIKAVFNQSAKELTYHLNIEDHADIFIQENISAQSLKTPVLLEATLSELNLEHWSEWSKTRLSKDGSSLEKIAKITLKTDILSGFGQQFLNVDLTAHRHNKAWQTQIASGQMNGSIWIPEVMSNQAKLTLDLDNLMLSVPKNMAPSTTSESSLWPPLTLNIDDLSIDGKALGHLTLKAKTEGTEWVIEQGQLNSPVYQASITAGRWSKRPTGDKTTVSLQASSDDFAGFLKTFSYQPTIEAQQSKAEIAMSWPGTPLAISKQALNGSLYFRLKKGTLNDIEPGAAGRVLGLVSVAAIPRRLGLDFNEVFGKGLSFKSIRGTFIIGDGIAITDDFKLKSDAAEIEIKGPINLITQRYNQTVKITPNVSSSLPLAGAVALGPYGLGFGTAILLADKLASKLFDKNLINLMAYNYELTGPWQDPQLQSVDRASGKK